MFDNPLIRGALLVCFGTAMIAAPAMSESPDDPACPSGQSSARLTGWQLGGKYPRGTAKYNEATTTLEVSVQNVALDDGKVLSVLIEDERIGQMPPLAKGSATTTITRVIADGARVRVFDADRPVVSANLKCVAPASLPTATPTPAPTPTPTPTPSPTPSVSPMPTAEPTQDPMPKSTPHPTPSPYL